MSAYTRKLENECVEKADELHIAVQSGVGYMGTKQMRHAVNVIDSLIGIVRDSSNHRYPNLPPKDALGKFSRAVTAFTRAWTALENGVVDNPSHRVKNQILTRLIQTRGIISNNPNFKPAAVESFANHDPS